MSHAFRSLLINRFSLDIKQIMQLPFHQEMIKDKPNSAYHQQFISFIHYDASIFLPRFGQTLKVISREYEPYDPINSKIFADLATKNNLYIQQIYNQYPEARYCSTPNHHFFYKPPNELELTFQQYSRYLVKPVTIAEALTKITACIWLYDELGKGLNIYACTKDNPYLPWLRGYNDPSSVATTQLLLEALGHAYEKERCPIKKENILKIVQTSLELEYNIFHCAYRQESVAQYGKVY